MYHLDDTDKSLLTILQNGFPLVTRPYEALGLRLAIPEQEVIERTANLKKEGIIRGINAILDSRRIGYLSGLAAMEVRKERLTEAVEIINGHPGISHNYERDHSLNLWFTLTVPPSTFMEEVLEALNDLCRPERAFLFSTIRVFKIRVNFDMKGEVGAVREPPLQYPREVREPPLQYPGNGAVHLSKEDIGVIRELQKELPLELRPFLTSADNLGIMEEELLGRIGDLQARGVIRRVAAVLYHRRIGYRANAMIVWKVPEDRIEEVGLKAASFQSVSHCVQRETYPDWLYNLYTMVHGHTREECERVIESIKETTGVQDYEVLYSTREFKKARIEYFSEDFDRWEDKYLKTKEVVLK